jgi:cytochrome c oxidase assembly protein subunit 11
MIQQQRLPSFAPGWGTACSSASSARHFWGGKPKYQPPVSGKLRQRYEINTQLTWWFAAAGMALFGAVFALVPLYKLYCQSTGQGQAIQTGHKIYAPPPTPGSSVSKKLVTVDFAATVHPSLPWEFVPQQRRVVVGLGETALAFYRAKNKSDRPIIGVSVYHMIPPEAGLYFNKIQCFCFDEQLINPGEEVDLPIFFFIDPIMGIDNRFDHVDRITLSYLFFESDSDLPEEYEDFKKSLPSSVKPPALDAPPTMKPLT